MEEILAALVSLMVAPDPGIGPLPAWPLWATSVALVAAAAFTRRRVAVAVPLIVCAAAGTFISLAASPVPVDSVTLSSGIACWLACGLSSGIWRLRWWRHATRMLALACAVWSVGCGLAWWTVPLAALTCALLGRALAPSQPGDEETATRAI